MYPRVSRVFDTRSDREGAFVHIERNGFHYSQCVGSCKVGSDLKIDKGVELAER